MAGGAYPAVYEGVAGRGGQGLSGRCPGGRGEMIYERADAFSVTAGGFVLIQRQHSGARTDLAVFAPNAWLCAEVVPEPAPGLG